MTGPTPDRRQQAQPVTIERRCGERRQYQQGCRCLPCRAANAAYEALYRTRKAKGLPMPGHVVEAVDTQRQLRLLRTEYETMAALAQRLGLQDRHIQFGRRMTVRNVVKVRRLYQLDILAGLETYGEEVQAAT